MNEESYWSRRSTSRFGRRRFVGALAGGVALGVAGCGDDDEPKATAARGSAAATSAGTAAATTAPSPTRQPADFLSSLSDNPPDPIQEKDFKAGGKAIRLTDRPINGFQIIGGASSTVAETGASTWSKLIRLGCRANMPSTGQAQLEGDLATAWEQPDPTTVIFTLTPGVKHQNVAPLNGRALSFDDIKFSLSRTATHPKSQYKQYGGIIKDIQDVGSGKIRLNLARPYFPALLVLTHLAFTIVPTEFGQDAPTTAAGTGPFIIERITPNVEIVYRKNPDYFKKDSTGRQRPYMDGYTLSVVADAATRQALVEAGKADTVVKASQPFGLDNIEAISKRAPNLMIQKLKNPSPNWSLAGHHTKAPWNDLRVRQALSKSMNYDLIMQSVQKGHSMTGQFFPWPFLFDKAPTVAELGANYAFDIAEAKKLLSAAGFPNGMELSLDWYVSADNESVIQIMQQSAAAAGFKLNLVKAPDVVALTLKRTQKDWPGLLVYARSADFLDPSATVTHYLPGSGSNIGDVNDPEIVQLAQKLESTTGEERKRYGKQLYDNQNRNLWEIPLPMADTLFAWSSRFHNFRETTWFANSLGVGGYDQVWLSS